MSLATPLPERRRASAGFWLLALQLSQCSEAQRLANIQAGFAPGWVRAMRDAFTMGPRQMESLFNLSTSTLERRQRQQQSLDAIASERLDRVAMVASHALRVFETPERAGHWMITLNVALGGRTPLQACETGIGTAQAHRALATLESA
ncbi:antitoxin Xre-like helix-turn-helix domain-containing protein [Pseudomonas syringae]|uniref:antitoxin Xre-like helix-turn-helix domain-containing protein n=1 Tax=Pseudomonas syringae TaxID=317 RepID=UPI0003FAFB67|nr:antitoxin Xre-like helix-turn-helix domain-containing protein [Pseudomonas syringae]